MKLKDIIKKSTLQTKIINPLNFFVKGISIHSDQVRNNFIFAAMKGRAHHGLDFIKDLLDYKNIAVVLSKRDKIPKDFRKSKSVDRWKFLLKSLVILPNTLESPESRL